MHIAASNIIIGYDYTLRCLRISTLINENALHRHLLPELLSIIICD